MLIRTMIVPKKGVCDKNKNISANKMSSNVHLKNDGTNEFDVSSKPKLVSIFMHTTQLKEMICEIQSTKCYQYKQHKVTT